MKFSLVERLDQELSRSFGKWFLCRLSSTHSEMLLAQLAGVGAGPAAPLNTCSHPATLKPEARKDEEDAQQNTSHFQAPPSGSRCVWSGIGLAIMQEACPTSQRVQKPEKGAAHNTLSKDPLVGGTKLWRKGGLVHGLRVVAMSIGP